MKYFLQLSNALLEMYAAYHLKHNQNCNKEMTALKEKSSYKIQNYPERKYSVLYTGTYYYSCYYS